MANMVAQFGGIARKLPGLSAGISERKVARRAIQAALDGRR